ncbi:MAG: type I-C CRISPR-associated endonuclease Cas1c [Candidatus Desulforudis sp.]|nr:type I-C CRISPR-associated endonuclease Cas1c [Desulforudis sp.]MBV1734200.1 type I-C CRISPR-associated endonuclease Cas1c [Desulforudis sp.]
MIFKHLLNVLYVLTEDSYLHKQGETICVRVGGEEKVRVPVHTIDSIVCFSNTTVSTPLLAFCGEKGVGLAFFSPQGRFYARLEGPVRGNVLLRTRQYEVARDPMRTSEIIWLLINAKIANAKTVLLRVAREHGDTDAATRLRQAASNMSMMAKKTGPESGGEQLRGYEGMAANIYFGQFDDMIRANKTAFYFRKRSKRPPEDNMNAIMSFLYSLLTNEVKCALEGVGLDPAVGYLHKLRPGRPSLALDIMEELRAPLCDRLALSLVNLRQVKEDDFRREVGGVYMRDETRRKIISAWQKRKKEEVVHTFLRTKMPIGLIPHVQALLFARFLRGDVDYYPPFMWR